MEEAAEFAGDRIPIDTQESEIVNDDDSFKPPLRLLSGGFEVNSLPALSRSSGLLATASPSVVPFLSNSSTPNRTPRSLLLAQHKLVSASTLSISSKTSASLSETQNSDGSFDTEPSPKRPVNPDAKKSKGKEMERGGGRAAWVTLAPQLGDGKSSVPRSFLRTPKSPLVSFDLDLTPSSRSYCDDDLMQSNVKEPSFVSLFRENPNGQSMVPDDSKMVVTEDGAEGEREGGNDEKEGESVGEGSKRSRQRRDGMSRVVSGVIFRLDRSQVSSRSSKIIPSSPKKGRRRGKRYVVALQDYYATIADVLSFKKNDIIVVTGFISTHWREGTNLRTGENGIFPLMYIRDACATEVATTFLASEQIDGEMFYNC
jgi:hypothetical protein